MQQDGSGNAGQQQQPQQGGGVGGIGGPPGQMTAAQQAQYRATLLQQQQIQAMQAAMRAQQQRNNANGQLQGQQQQQQQQQYQAQQQMARPMPNQQQAAQQRPLQQGGNANAAQLQALQQLFQNNPEQLAMFVNMSKDGKLTPEQLNQLRGAVTAVQQQHQQQQQMQQMQQQQGGRPPAQAQQPRPAPLQQQSQQPQVNQQQQIRPASQSQQGQTQGQAGANVARPPVFSAAAQEIQGKMMAIQRQAEQIIKKLKELEVALSQAPAQGGLAPGTPERMRLEKESTDLKSQQNKLAMQFMAHKAQYLAEIGQPQQSQQVQQQLVMQQRAAAQQAATAAAAAAATGATGGQTQSQMQAAIANQNRAAGTPPQHNARPPSANNPRQSQDQNRNSRPPTPGTGAVQTGTNAKGSPSVQGKSNTTTASSPQYQHPQVPPEAMTHRSNLMSGPSTASSMAGGNGQGPFGASIATQLNVQPSVPEPYPNSQGPRPTLNQGLGTNPTLGTPAILQRPDPLTGNTSGANAGATTASGTGTANWEELLGLTSKESKGGLQNLTASELETVMADPNNPDFWDALTGKGTGADSLVNAGTVTANVAGTSGLTNADGRLLTKRKVQELVAEIDANERLEGDVEDLLLEIADEFIDSVTHFSCKLAKHRKGDKLEVRDVQLHLERNWNLRIPTPGSVPIPPPRIKATAQQSGSGAKANTTNNSNNTTNAVTG